MQLHELACSSFLCLSSSQEFRSACFEIHISLHVFKDLSVFSNQKIRKYLRRKEREINKLSHTDRSSSSDFVGCFAE